MGMHIRIIYLCRWEGRSCLLQIISYQWNLCIE